jgi:hypothetical protein
MSEHNTGQNKRVIHIDHDKFEVEESSLTGADLRALPDPTITSDYDLFLENPDGQDELIGDDQIVELKNGMHFFSVQKTINPGA